MPKLREMTRSGSCPFSDLIPSHFPLLLVSAFSVTQHTRLNLICFPSSWIFPSTRIVLPNALPILGHTEKWEHLHNNLGVKRESYRLLSPRGCCLRASLPQALPKGRDDQYVTVTSHPLDLGMAVFFTLFGCQLKCHL